ncbi:MAG TPA: PadR family transcriptional regulator [Vicinamibacterales bacterium]|nr:PadR family transcriptional regulator [Vicinamibacterales bacterium]
MPPDRIPTSELPLKPDVLQILLTLAQGPLHGYAVMQQIEESTDGAVVMQAGAFYRTLRNMLADGIVEECDDPAPTGRDRKARRFYRITRSGRAVAHAEVQRLSQLVRLGHRQLGRRRS